MNNQAWRCEKDIVTTYINPFSKQKILKDTFRKGSIYYQFQNPDFALFFNNVPTIVPKDQIKHFTKL